MPYVPGGLIVNLGDLMRRWTNDLWLSTLHRVIIPSTSTIPSSHSTEGEVAEISENYQCISSINTDCSSDVDSESIVKRRQSLAFFVNVNPDAQISTLPGPVIAKNGPTKYDPIIAGDFLLLKHIAAQAKQ